MADFAKIAEQLFPMCSKVSLSISTEPMLHRNIEELLEITGNYKVPFIYMFTNGILLNPSVVAKIINANVHQLSISIDGATKKTYERIRVGATFERLMTNIAILNSTKEAMHSDNPHICFNIVLMRSNITELPELVRLARSLRVKSIAAVHMVQHDIAAVSAEESLQFDKELCNRMLEEAQTLADIYNIETDFPEKFVSDTPSVTTEQSSDCRHICPVEQTPIPTADPSCRFPWRFVGLDSDGNLIPCGWWFRQAPMGNLFTDSFEVIWNNDNYRRLRSEHISRGLRTICQTCPMGSINNSNYFLVQ